MLAGTADFFAEFFGDAYNAVLPNKFLEKALEAEHAKSPIFFGRNAVISPATHGGAIRAVCAQWRTIAKYDSKKKTCFEKAWPPHDFYSFDFDHSSHAWGLAPLKSELSELSVSDSI